MYEKVAIALLKYTQGIYTTYKMRHIYVIDWGDGCICGNKWVEKRQHVVCARGRIRKLRIQPATECQWLYFSEI